MKKKPDLFTNTPKLASGRTSFHYLLLTLEQAESRRGFCAPNPSVGAIVVKDDKVIASGKHWAFGEAHAEVDALRNIENESIGATLFVTLEPCCHQGKTPPCTELIIQRGIKCVVFALMDPNPVVSGKGMQALQEAGIDCQQIDVTEITDFYRSYVYWMQEKRPWVTMKLALSADDKIAKRDGKPIEITGEACRKFTHGWRQRSDALLTTVQTIINDDPQMNVRLATDTIPKPLYILDSKLQLPLHARIFKTAKSITVYHREDCDVVKINKLQQRGVRCVSLAGSVESSCTLDLKNILDDIGQQGIHDLWVEVGARCFQSFYQGNLAQRIFLYRSKKTVGDAGLPAFPGGKTPLFNKELVWKPLGEEMFCELVPKYSASS